MIGCLPHTPNQGPGPQPRCVPSLGIEPRPCVSVYSPPGDSFAQCPCLPISVVSLSLPSHVRSASLHLNVCPWFPVSLICRFVSLFLHLHTSSPACFHPSLSPCFLTLCSSYVCLCLGFCLAATLSLSLSSGDSGNWIEIAYGTSSGGVRVIVQHPETVGSGPQLFQTFTVHRSPVIKTMLSEKHLISGGPAGCPCPLPAGGAAPMGA